MVEVSLDEAIELTSTRLDNILKENPEISKPFKAMILGGYALHAICQNYGIKVERKTNDIDLFSPDARILMSGDVALSPTGARILLTGDSDDPASFNSYCGKKEAAGQDCSFYAELFDWISGMDRGKDLEAKIFSCLEKGNAKKLKTGSKYVELYLPTPEIFVANKLFSYREHTSREKDLKDVGLMLSILEFKDKPALERVEKLVEQYKLQEEYKKAQDYKLLSPDQKKLI
jgi:hypothetical protein